jgi:HPt (histidine-containing phosphotransfer) domain-containing protein
MDRENDTAVTCRRVNPETLEQLRSAGAQCGRPVLKRAIEAYLGSVPSLLDALAVAISEDSPDSMARTAHALKSASGAIGASKLSECFGELDELGRSGSTKDAAIALEAILIESDGVSQELREELRAEGDAIDFE